MCKRLADGTMRYCPSRAPGARSRQKAAGRTKVAAVARDMSSYLPPEGTIRTGGTLAEDRLVEAGRQWVSSLEPEELDEARNYTKGTDAQINGCLRENRGALAMDAAFTFVDHHSYDDEGNETGETYVRSLASSVQTLDAALAKAPRLEEPIVVYRGLHVKGGQAWAESKFVPGKNLVLPGYSSTTVDPSEAARFGGTSPVVMEIVTTRGSFVDEISGFGSDTEDSLGEGEKEVMFPRNARFKVVGVDTGLLPITYDDDGEDEVLMQQVTFVRMVEVEHPQGA